MADSEKAPEAMETSSAEQPDSSLTEAGGSSKATENGADKTQDKTEKQQAKPAGKVASIKKDAAGFSSVSPSYSQLQSGLQDIVKSYVASKSSTSKSTPSSNAKPEEEKKTDDTNGKRKAISPVLGKANDDSHASVDDERERDRDRNIFDEFLDRTKSDFYCKICDSHMNSEQMWENHVQGKRHLKNVKKDPGEPPSKVKAVRTDLVAKVVKLLAPIREPVVGLDYMCELQRAESYLDPTYSCFLCHATCTVSSVVDHILGTKHRLAYLKEVNSAQYALVEEMKLKKSGLTSIAEDYARELERKYDRGRMEVKIEKPKMAPPPSKKERRYLDDDDDDDDYDILYRRRPRSPMMEVDWRRDRWSPPPTSSMIQQMRSSYMMPSPNYSAMSMMEKLSVLRQVSSNLIVVSESEGKEVMQIINSLTQSLLQYKIRVLPPTLQDTLARHIISGDAQGLESTLGLGGSGMSNVSNVINSMAATGDLPPMRSHRGLSPPPMHPIRMMPAGMGGGPNSSESARSPWGPNGGLGARMPSPLRGGGGGGGGSSFRTSYPGTSQWPGGMGAGPFRGSDRSSLGY